MGNLTEIRLNCTADNKTGNRLDFSAVEAVRVIGSTIWYPVRELG